jgi:hypothetical protein
MLAWTPGGLPPGLGDAVARLPGVEHAVAVVSGTMWLTRSVSEGGATVDHPPRGLAIPLEVAGARLTDYAPFLSPSERVFLPDLARGQGVLGETSAVLRRVGPGALISFGGRHVRVAGVVPDSAIGAHEVFVSRRSARELGVTRERYLLIDPGPNASRQRLSARIRALLPQGTPLRIRGPGETPYFRQGDAVLAPVRIKELFGEFVTAPAPGGYLRSDPVWEAQHIVAARVPILGSVRCNRAILPQLRGALSEIQAKDLGQLIDPSQYGGCYSPRFANRNPEASISHHAWGVAVDINVATNRYGHTPRIDHRVVAIFERWGFTWGGRFLIPDGMHFEFIRFAFGG